MIRKEQPNKISLGFKLRARVMLVILLFVIFPISAVIYLYEAEVVRPGENLLFALPLFIFIIIAPLTSLIINIVFQKPMVRIIDFCRQIREGNYNIHFNLPNQRDDESIFVAMLRELEAVANHIRVNNRDFICAVRDTKDTAEKMKNLAIKDALTELYNRRYFDAMILDEITHACRNDSWLTLLMLDCDKFKQINDNLGHAVGDNTLKLLADTIKGAVRSNRDIPFRFGGDEFGIILPSADASAAVVVAKRIQEKYRACENFGTSLSISITSAKVDSIDNIDSIITSMIDTTDKGLYRVKALGGNDISVNVMQN